MNIRKRAGLYLIRKKGRAALLFCLLFLMSINILIGFSLKESTERELDRLRLSMASGFILKANMDNEMYKEVTDYGNGATSTHYAGPMVTDEMIEKVLSLDGVEDYSLINEIHVAWTNLTLRPGLYAGMEPDPNPNPNDLFPCTEETLELDRHSTDVYACRNGKHHKNFRTGALAITEGRNLETEDHFKAVISDWLAEKNRLVVGDTIVLETKEGNYDITEKPLKRLGEAVTVEIAGLFHANFSQPSSDMTLEHCYVENIIYVDEDTYLKLQDNLKEHARYQDIAESYEEHNEVEFLVKDPAQIDSIMQQIRNRDDIDLENIELETDSSAYEASAGPYRGIRIFSMALLALGLCGMGVILYLLIHLWMQGRRHEVGIYRSVGMKKREILGQMLIECFAVSFAALALAFLLAGPAAAGCADAAKRLAAPKEKQETYIVKVDKYLLPQIKKTSSDEVVLDSSVSVRAMGFAVLFVCGISGASVLVSFSKINSIELKNLLQQM